MDNKRKRDFPIARYFHFSHLQAAFGLKTKNPPASPGGLVEVGGGFEPP
jgi:hypothetical protein